MATMALNGPCPYCGAGDYYFYSLGGGVDSCPLCQRVGSHEHAGVLTPHACGPLMGFWDRLLRWCWLKEAHTHRTCSRCHGKWISPPVGVKGEPMLTKPKKIKNRYQRDPVI